METCHWEWKVMDITSNILSKPNPSSFHWTGLFCLFGSLFVSFSGFHQRKETVEKKKHRWIDVERHTDKSVKNSVDSVRLNKKVGKKSKTWVFPRKLGVKPQNGWWVYNGKPLWTNGMIWGYIPLFLETSTCISLHCSGFRNPSYLQKQNDPLEQQDGLWK